MPPLTRSAALEARQKEHRVQQYSERADWSPDSHRVSKTAATVAD
jgi:hypothetical protein